MTRKSLIALILLSAAPLAQADVFDPAGSPLSTLAVTRDPVTLAPGITVARTEMITGTDSITLPFVIPTGFSGGSVSVSLMDLAWPASFDSLSFAATTSSSLLGQLAGAGSLTFNVAGSGMYFATVYGVANLELGSGLYSLNLRYAPVPAPAAALLLASGLLLLRKRRGKNSVINAG